MTLWDFWDIGRRLETLVEPSTEEDCFKKAGTCPDGRIANCGPNCGPEVALSPHTFGPSPALPWSRGSPAPLVTGLLSSDPTVNPEVVPSPS